MQTFEQLPPEERALIRSVLNAVNRERADLALNHARDDGRGKMERVKDAHLAPRLKKRMAAAALEARAFWQQYDKDQMWALRTALLRLAEGKRLSQDQLYDLAGTFEGGVAVERQAKVYSDGRVEFINVNRYRDPFAAIAYVVLQLAALSKDKKTLLVCQHCGTFSLVPKTGGTYSTKFCPPVTDNGRSQCRTDYYNEKSRSKHK